VAHVRLDVVKCLLIAGPGFAKDSFREFLLGQANKTGNKSLVAFKQSIVTAPASTAYLQGVEVRLHLVKACFAPVVAACMAHLYWSLLSRSTVL
jgi:stalled ribosome rescue protein Dom34